MAECITKQNTEDAHHYTRNQRVIHNVCESAPVMVFLLSLVLLAVTLTLSEFNNKAIQVAMASVFVLEQVFRVYAETPSFYFYGAHDAKFNCLDFIVTIVDVIATSMFVAGNSNKTTVRVMQLLRTVRIFHFSKHLSDVFSKQRSDSVMRRKKLLRSSKAKIRAAVDAQEAQIAATKATPKVNSAAHAPSVEIAKDHGETFKISRRIRTVDGEYRANKPGETGGELYPIVGTSVEQIGHDFGLGVGLYFYTLIALALLMCVLFMMMLPAALYFKSPEYRNGLEGLESVTLMGTASCELEPTLVRNYTNTTHNATYTVFARPNCQIKKVNMWSGIMSIVVAMGALCIYSTHVEKVIHEIDVRRQTAQDYSVEVHDPCPDATDPDEWHKFFSQYGEVLAITVALDNGTLIKRLQILKHYSEVLATLPASTGLWLDEKFPNWPALRNVLRDAGIGRDLVWWRRHLHTVEEEIKLLMRAEYMVVKVYCTYDLEHSQRNALRKLTVGSVAAALDLPCHSMPKSDRFRGHNILHVTEAPEPHEVRWEKIGIVTNSQIISQRVMLVFIAILIMLITLLLEKVIKDSIGLITLATFVAVLNIAVPLIIDNLVRTFEVHEFESSEMASLFFKKALFRAWNSAIVTYLLLDFPDVLTEKNVKQVQLILFADCVIVPLSHCLDIPHYLEKRFLGPLVSSQSELDSMYSGGYVVLDEMFSDIFKTFFLTMFYLPLLPTGTLIAACSYVLIFWGHKYGLLRRWRTLEMRKCDGKVGHLFIEMTWLGIAGHIWMTLRLFAGWPMDTACDAPDAGQYIACEKKPIWHVFYGPKDWMPKEQHVAVQAFGTAFLLFLSAAAIYVVFFVFRRRLWELFHKEHSNTATICGTPFSGVEHASFYVPISACNTMNGGKPMLACCMSTFDHLRYVPDMADEISDHPEDHSVYHYAIPIMEELNVLPEKVFSSCKQYCGPRTDLERKRTKREEEIGANQSHSTGGAMKVQKETPCESSMPPSLVLNYALSSSKGKSPKVPTSQSANKRETQRSKAAPSQTSSHNRQTQEPKEGVKTEQRQAKPPEQPRPSEQPKPQSKQQPKEQPTQQPRKKEPSQQSPAPQRKLTLADLQEDSLCLQELEQKHGKHLKILV